MTAATKRKHVYQAATDELLLPEDGQFIVQVLAGRGNNLHEVIGPDKQSFLVSMPPCFRKNIWIKRGDFLLCENIPEGDKVRAEIVHPLSSENIEYIKKKDMWPNYLSDGSRKRRATDEMYPKSDSEADDDEDYSNDDLEDEDTTSPDYIASMLEEFNISDDVELPDGAIDTCNPNRGNLFAETVDAVASNRDGPGMDETCAALTCTESTSEQVMQKKWTRERLESWLTENGVSWTVKEHPEVFTVEAALEYLKDVPGHFAKNLFLRDKKRGSLFLLCARHQACTNLNAIGKALGVSSGRLRFGPETDLYEKLGVKQGCVTLFGIMNDANAEVELLLEDGLVSDPETMVWFHPFVNSATFGMLTKDVFRILGLLNRNHRRLRISDDGSNVEIL